MKNYDIIGDIHGHADRAKHLLKKLGYREKGGAFKHPSRHVLFLGDLIDRGPDQIATVDMVRRMVDAGSAEVVMGNHEYNAVAYAIEDPEHEGQYLRKHTKTNRHQHAAFLDQVGEGSPLHREFISWFKTLPLAFENESIRAIHACWHSEYLDSIADLLNDNRSLKDHAWVEMSRKGTQAHAALETLLKGLEIDLPNGVFYHDKDGTKRTRTRTRWWDAEASTYRQLGLVAPAIREQLPEHRVDEHLILKYDNAKPVFIGHYWLSGTPSRLSDQIACLDYSIGKGCPTGKLCAYRWDGEDTLDDGKFVWVDGAAPQKRPLDEPGLG